MRGLPSVYGLLPPGSSFLQVLHSFCVFGNSAPFSFSDQLIAPFQMLIELFVYLCHVCFNVIYFLPFRIYRDWI